MENPSEDLIKYGEYLDNFITTNDNQEYIFGLNIRDELIKDYNYDMNSMIKKVKKLAKEYYE